MICPQCGGSGRVVRRFLIFWTRERRCLRCLGTGQFPPPLRDVVRHRPRYRDDDDDSVAIAPGRAPSSSAPDRRDTFQVGDGGRSGGGGAAASWGDAESGSAAAGDAPLIVDPFASDASSSADAVEAGGSDSGPADSGSATQDSESADSGTSY